MFAKQAVRGFHLPECVGQHGGASSQRRGAIRVHFHGPTAKPSSYRGHVQPIEKDLIELGPWGKENPTSAEKIASHDDVLVFPC